MINYHTYSYEENEHLYGPGRRLLLFCQGCSIRCNGCVNSHLWNFSEGKDMSTQEIVELCKGTDGITLHGGEPLDQSEGVADVVKALKRAGKTVILFTGYNYSELKLPSQRYAWRYSDIVVAGRYEEDKRNIYLQFRGSANQRIYTHNGKYKDYNVTDGKTVAIFRLGQDGNLQSRGFQSDELNCLLKDLKV